MRSRERAFNLATPLNPESIPPAHINLEELNGNLRWNRMVFPADQLAQRMNEAIASGDGAAVYKVLEDASVCLGFSEEDPLFAEYSAIARGCVDYLYPETGEENGTE